MQALNERNGGLATGFEKAIEAVWLLIIFLVPIAYDPYTLNPYYFVKSLLQVLLVCVLLGLVLAQQVISLRPVAWREIPTQLKRSPLHLAVLAFALLWIISTVFSIMPYKSLWGNLAGSVGLLPNLAWMTFFFIVSLKIKSRSQVIRALYALVLSSGILSLIGVLQFYFAPWALLGGRVVSIEGNPLSLSGFIGMSLPITLALILMTWYAPLPGRVRLTRFCALLAILALEGWCLALAQYSITLLLFVIGMFAFFVLVGIFTQRKAALGLSILALLFIALIAVGLLGQMMIPENGSIPGESRSPNATVAEQVGLGTLPIRLQTWECAIDVITRSPEIPNIHDNFHALRRLIGYGPETFIAMSQTTFPPAWKAQYTFQSLVISQPEDHYLYLAVTLGLLGLLAFLAILAAFFYPGIRYLLRSSADREAVWLGSALMAAVIQYCAHVFFDPSVITAELAFWLALSLMVALIRIESSAAVTSPLPSGPKMDAVARPGVSRTVAAVVVLLLSAALGLGLTVRPLLANSYVESGLSLFNADKKAAMEMYLKATAIEPGQSYYHNFVGNLAYVMALDATEGSDRTRLLQQSEAAYRNAVNVDPAMAIWYYRLADVDVYWALNGGQGKYDQAVGLYREADSIFPGNAVILDKWGLALTFKGDYEAAAQVLDSAASSDPLWIQTSFYQGLLQAYKGDNQAAFRLFSSPVSNDPKDIGYFINFCNQMAIYGTQQMDSVSAALKSGVSAGDWKGNALLGISYIYADRHAEAVGAFEQSAKIVPAGNVPLLAGLVNAMLVNRSGYQDEGRQIFGSLMERMQNR